MALLLKKICKMRFKMHCLGIRWLQNELNRLARMAANCFCHLPTSKFYRPNSQNGNFVREGVLHFGFVFLGCDVFAKFSPRRTQNHFLDNTASATKALCLLLVIVISYREKRTSLMLLTALENIELVSSEC
jgi:hypothetical protein